jgi:ketosteroid isomerase-like protein
MRMGSTAEYIKAVNAFDTDAIVATFAEDAYVNDNRRENIAGIDATRRSVEKEMVSRPGRSGRAKMRLSLDICIIGVVIARK